MRLQWSFNYYLTYILLTLLFVSSWTDVNGIFAELPQIVLTQPEGWKLAAHLSLITNMGNISPLALALIKTFCRKWKINPIPINYTVIIVGMISCLLLIFFWSYTTVIGNERRSTALLILSFSLSFLDCTSSVSYFAYVNMFRKEFLNTIFLGESLTTILPSLLAIAQGNGRIHCITNFNGTNKTETVYEPPRFTVSIYFMCLLFLLVISFVSFLILQWTSVAKSTRKVAPESSLELNDIADKTQSITISRPIYYLLSFGCMLTNAVMFGLALSFTTYILMPYGQNVFYLGTILAPWMFVIVWFLGNIKNRIPKRYVLIILLVGVFSFGLQMYAAFKSPCPPWVNTTKGSVLIIILWLSNNSLFGYARLVIAHYAQAYSPDGLFWFGAQIQTGALIGSIIGYIIIEPFGILRERYPCEEFVC